MRTIIPKFLIRWIQSRSLGQFNQLPARSLVPVSPLSAKRCDCSFILIRLIKENECRTNEPWLVSKRHFSTTQVRLAQEDKNSENKQNPDNQNNLFRLVQIVVSMYVFSVLLSYFRGSKGKDEEQKSYTRISWQDFEHEMLSKGEVKEVCVSAASDEAAQRRFGIIVKVFLHDDAVFKGKIVRPRHLFVLQADSLERFERDLHDAQNRLGIPADRRIPLVIEREYTVSWLTFGLIAVILLLLSSVKKTGKSALSQSMNPFDSLRKARYKLFDPGSFINQKPKVKFADVAGLHEAKVEIREFVDYVKKPETFTRLGAKLPKGALLLGPPGCGKTLLAKAVASEASVPFLAVNGPEFVEMIGGLGAARVRDLFAQAKKVAPCIIHIDELDAIGRQRGGAGDSFSGSSEEENTLNQLLVEMDGMDTIKGIVVMASTNRPDILDKALLRKGRFDRHISIDLPTRLERIEIFNLYLKKLKLAPSAETFAPKLADMTPGFSGADIFNVCNEAALSAATWGHDEISFKDLSGALEKIMAGPEKKTSTISQSERELVAYHEAGQALLSWILPNSDALLKVSIVPRTSHPLGKSQYAASDFKLFSKDQLFDRMCAVLGGRAAESLVFNKTSTYSEKDLKKVTQIIYDQIKSYGMNEAVGPLSFGYGSPSSDDKSDQFVTKPYSKELQALIDREAQRLLGSVYQKAETLLRDNRTKLETLATELLKRETLHYDDIKVLIGEQSGDKKRVDYVESMLPPPLEKE